jgi:hypothetical protein
MGRKDCKSERWLQGFRIRRGLEGLGKAALTGQANKNTNVENGQNRKCRRKNMERPGHSGAEFHGDGEFE